MKNDELMDWPIARPARKVTAASGYGGIGALLGILLADWLQRLSGVALPADVAAQAGIDLADLIGGAIGAAAGALTGGYWTRERADMLRTGPGTLVPRDGQQSADDEREVER